MQNGITPCSRNAILVLCTSLCAEYCIKLKRKIATCNAKHPLLLLRACLNAHVYAPFTGKIQTTQPSLTAFCTFMRNSRERTDEAIQIEVFFSLCFIFYSFLSFC